MLIIINLKNEKGNMKKLTITSVFLLFAFVSSLFANEVNIFSARHYDSDVQLYEKFTAKTGIGKLSGLSGLTILPPFNPNLSFLVPAL